MKTQIKIIIPVVIIGIVLSFLIFKTDNTNNIEENPVHITENNSTEIKNIQDYENKDLVLNQELISENNSSTEEISDDIDENLEPKEISVVAEDILYPEEYEFKADIDDTIRKIGFPIKLDLKPFTNLKVGDTLELTFGEHTVTAEVYDFQLKEYDDSKRFTIRCYVDPDIDDTNHNSVRISVHYFDNGEIFSDIVLGYIGGDYEFTLRENLGYYYDTHKLDDEYWKQDYGNQEHWYKDY